MQVWDRGTWAPLDPATVDHGSCRRRTEICSVWRTFLSGGFVLVRMKPRRGESDRHHNWLLIKERDSVATPGAGDAVLRAETSVLSGRTLDQIAAAGGQLNTEPNPESAGHTSAATKAGAAPHRRKPSAAGNASGKAATRKASGKAAGVTTPAVKTAAVTTPAIHKASAKPNPLGSSGAPRKPSAKAAAVAMAAPRKAPAKATRRGPSGVPRMAAAKAGAATAETFRKPPAKSTHPAASATAIPRFIAPQLCKLVDTPPTGDAWVHELKLDGYRLQLRVESGNPVLRTRTGLDWTERFPSIARAAAALPDCLMDGEAVALDAKGHPSFAALQATLAGEQHAPIVYFVFDLLHDGHRDLRNDPLQDRKRLLQPMIPEHETALRYLDHFAGPGGAVLGSACALGMEGIVSKRREGRYSSGRGDGWTKAKCRGRDEFLVGGWTTGKNGRGLGALLVGAQRDGKLVYLGRVGTGFSVALGGDLVRRLATRRASASPFAGRQPARTSGVNWTTPELVVELAYAGWTEAEGLLRRTQVSSASPRRQAGLRGDVARCAGAGGGGRPTGTIIAAGGQDFGDRSPDQTCCIREADHKPPGSCFVARDECNTGGHQSQPGRLLRALCRPSVGADRWPVDLTIVRTPDGVSGQLFVQRFAMRGQSPLIGTVTIAAQRQPYLRIDDAAGLAALAQISAVELHPWGARADDPDTPDRLVFDLDPSKKDCPSTP